MDKVPILHFYTLNVLKSGEIGDIAEILKNREPIFVNLFREL